MAFLHGQQSAVTITGAIEIVRMFSQKTCTHERFCLVLDVPKETVKNQNDNTSPRSRNSNNGVSATHGALHPPLGGTSVVGGALLHLSHRATATQALSDSEDLETTMVSIPPARQELELARRFQADQVGTGITLESGLCYVCSPPSGGFSGSLQPAFEGNLTTSCLELTSQLISLVLKIRGHHHSVRMYSPHLREGSWGACPEVSTFGGGGQRGGSCSE